MKHLRRINENKNVSNKDIEDTIKLHITEVSDNPKDIFDYLCRLIENMPEGFSEMAIKNMDDDMFFSLFITLYNKEKDINKISYLFDYPQIRAIINDLTDYYVGENILKNVKYFLDNGADINYKGDENNTFLHSAWSKEMVEYLISKGAKIYIKNDDGETPLVKNSQQDNDLLIALLNAGADPRTKNNIGYNFITLCFGARGIGIDDDVIVALLENNPDVYKDIKDYLTYDSIKKRLKDFIDSEELGLL